MTIDKRMMTNFTLESLQNFNIHQAVFEACMEEVEYDGVIEDDDGKTLRLRDVVDNDLIQISLDNDGDYRVRVEGDIMYADTFEQALVEGLYLDAGGIKPLVDKMVARGVDKTNYKDYDGVKLKYATTVGRYENKTRKKKKKQTSNYVRLFVCIFQLVYTSYPTIRDIHNP